MTNRRQRKRHVDNYVAKCRTRRHVSNICADLAVRESLVNSLSSNAFEWWKKLSRDRQNYFISAFADSPITTVDQVEEYASREQLQLFDKSIIA